MTPPLRAIRNAVAEHVSYRELLYQMTRRDLLLRYKQTVIGCGWALLMPMVNTVVFSVIFTRVAPVATRLPYPLFAFCGLLAWNFSASSFRFAVGSLTSNASLVTKVYFPREIFPVSAVLVSLVDLAVGGVALAALALWYGVGPSWTLVALPLVLLVQLLFTTGVALLLAMANLFYRDVKYLFDVLITIWMFATSVLYPVEAVAGRLGQVMALNPMTHIVDAYRSVLLEGRWPGLPFAVTGVAVLGLALAAWALFHQAESRFAENV